jgi:DivIVA domain-containing protein
VELERHLIERNDFSAARRGYDPDEVDRHLREIAGAVADLKDRAAAGKPAADVGAVASIAAEQVRSIVEAAEQSAAQIEERAEREARRLRGDAEQDARQTRERADTDAAEHVRKVEDATRGMLERSRSIEGEIDTLLSGLRERIGGLVEGLQSTIESINAEVREASGSLARTVEASAETLSSDLESIRSGLGDVRGARGPEPSVVEEPASFEPDEDSVERTQATALSAVPDITGEQEEIDLDREEEEEVEELEEEEEEDFASEVPEEEEFDTAAPAGLEPERAEDAPTVAGGEGARLIALNMALNGTPREETAKYLAENFELADQDAILDDVYSRVGQS